MHCSQLLRSLAAVGLVAALVSCRDTAKVDSRSTPDAATGSNHTTFPADRAPVIALETIGLERATADLQSNLDVEQIHDEAKKKLEKVGAWIAAGRPPTRAELAGLVSERYRGGVLRPAELQIVFQDSALTVFRATPKTDESPEDQAGDAYQGRSGLLSGLRDLLAPVDATQPIRTHFKTYRVMAEGEAVTLHSYFELAGRTDAGVVQQRAVWVSRWRRQSEVGLVLEGVHVADFQEVLGAGAEPLLSDCTASVLGNNASYREQLVPSTDHWIDRIELRYGIDPGAWLGLSVADVNGDGLDDLYLCQPGGLPNRLFVQNADGTATDVSSQAGVDWLDHTHAALLVDLDNDGDQDLVLALKPGLVFLSNDGQGRFVARSTKPIPKFNPYALSAADYDEDGYLDIYVCCYSMRRPDTDRQFIQRPVPYHDANNGGRNVLLKNQRNWAFEDVTRHVGLEHNNRRFSFAASWEDYDNDRDLDLYVANDYGRNNLYRNDRGKFTDVAAAAGVEDISAGMSVSWGDYDNDGWMDLYVSNMFSSAGNRIAYHRNFRAGDAASTRAEFQRHARGNSLFKNLGTGFFRDVSVQAGVTIGRWAWSSNFVDINNDGLDDLAVANGFITQEDSTDL